MPEEFDFMLPEDRAQKVVIFEMRRREWIETRNRGMARFVLFKGLLRSVSVILLWDIFYWAYVHVSIGSVARVTVVMLLLNSVFNLLEWHWNERRYRDRANRSEVSKSGVL